MICGDSRSGDTFNSFFLSLSPLPEIIEEDEVGSRLRNHGTPLGGAHSSPTAATLVQGHSKEDRSFLGHRAFKPPNLSSP